MNTNSERAVSKHESPLTASSISTWCSVRIKSSYQLKSESAVTSEISTRPRIKITIIMTSGYKIKFITLYHAEDEHPDF